MPIRARPQFEVPIEFTGHDGECGDAGGDELAVPILKQGRRLAEDRSEKAESNCGTREEYNINHVSLQSYVP